MISDIRTYFDEQIKLVDPDLSAWETDLFGNNDQSKPRAEKYYNLIIGVNNASRDGNSHWDAINVVLEVFAEEQRDLISSFDAVYEKAINIKNCILDTQNYLSNFRFNDIELILMQPEEEISNDNSIKMRIEFIIRRNYTF